MSASSNKVFFEEYIFSPPLFGEFYVSSSYSFSVLLSSHLNLYKWWDRRTSTEANSNIHNQNRYSDPECSITSAATLSLLQICLKVSDCSLPSFLLMLVHFYHRIPLKFFKLDTVSAFFEVAFGTTRKINPNKPDQRVTSMEKLILQIKRRTCDLSRCCKR